MTVKYMIIENEYFAARNLMKLVAAVRPDYRPAFCVESVEDAVDLLSTEPDIDLIFMDVELVDGNCFDILEQVDINVPVIFTTAYSDFAIKAFRLYSIDYLLKPLTKEAVETALDKYERWRDAYPPSGDNRPGVSLKQAGKGAEKPKSRILISEGDSYYHIPVEDISMVSSEDKYVFVHTSDGRRHITDYPNLNAVEDDLPREAFFRISRNVIVSIGIISSVKKYFKGRLKVSVKYGNTTFDTVISSARREAFLSWLGGETPD